MLSRLRSSASTLQAARSMLDEVAATQVPTQAISPAMRRIGRQRGPITRRIASQGGLRSATNTWVATLSAGTAALPVSTWFNAATVSQVCSWMNPPGTVRAFSAVTYETIHDFFHGHPFFDIAPEGQPVVVPPLTGLPAGIDIRSSAMAMRVAASDHLKRVNPGRISGVMSKRIPVAMSDVRTVLRDQTKPRETMAALAQVVVATASDATPTVPPPAAPNASIAGVDTIMVAPQFPQPMYEPLRDLSPDLLLPGLDAVLPDSVLGLETNRRFIEAFMVGLNFEMAREMLWRGFPTDQRGTCFDRFWGGAPDIQPLHLWGIRALGDAPSAPLRDKFVMLIRSALLRRYPNAVIYLTPAVQTAGGPRTPSEDAAIEKQPIFACSMQPDVAFFGFDVSADQATGADGGLGYYVVIQEHPTEPRFGLHAGVSIGVATHVAIGTAAPANQPLNNSVWGRNGAHMAGITRRLPVRLAIHASQFLPPAPAATNATPPANPTTSANPPTPTNPTPPANPRPPTKGKPKPPDDPNPNPLPTDSTIS